MHILFLSHYFPPEVNAPASRTWEHCRRWVAAGHELTVVTCAPNCPTGVVSPGFRNAWRHEECCEGVRVIRVWTLLAPNKGFVRRIGNYLSYLVMATLCAVRIKDFDVVVATSPQFFCGWAGVLVSRLRCRPLVLEIRDLWPDSIVAVGAMRPGPMIRLLLWLEAKLYAAATHIVTVGDDYRAGLVDKGVPADKISVVTNGVDLERSVRVRNTDALRAELNLTGRFVCGYIGTVGMAHGLEVVLAAAELAQAQPGNDITFLIVGDGAAREKLEQTARERGLDQVVFAGLLPKERMPELISACDACLVHLRGAELFSTVLPSKLFEFMALDVPVIMGVRGEAQQIVLEAGAGVAMTPDDPRSLLEAIRQIRSRPTDSFYGRKHVAKNFDRNRLAAKMLAIVERCAWQPNPGEPAMPTRVFQMRLRATKAAAADAVESQSLTIRHASSIKRGTSENRST